MDDVSSENAALADLLSTITDRRVRRKVHKLLQLGVEAVYALGEIDTALYLRDGGEDQLPIVADAVLSHLRRLLEYFAMVAPAGSIPDAPTSTRDMVPHRQRPDDDRWNALARELATLQYGLESELAQFEQRFGRALRSDNIEQAVRDLNDATTGLMDGVFAVMTTVYECFLGYAEPERMVPGHRDSLGKALAVRRALADLRRGVRGLNRFVQHPPSLEVAEINYRRIVDALNRFVESDVFFYLRSDTRRDIWQIQETLAMGSAVRNRLDCEGFEKYLDSLSFVSQRGVLIKHDSDLKVKIAADLERAIKFAAVLPEVVCEVIEQAFIKAERLCGLSDEIDRLVLQWASLTADDRADVEHASEIGRELLELIRPAPQSTRASDIDAF